MFFFPFEQQNNETEAEIDTTQALFIGQGMEKQEVGSQINFLKSKDKSQKTEVDDGEVCALVYRGRAGLFLRVWGATPFLFCFGP